MTHRRQRGPSVAWGLALLLAAPAGLPAAAEGGPAPEKPPWERLLRGEDARQAEQHKKTLDAHWEAAEFEKALPVAEALASLRQNAQGPDHWQTVSARWKVKEIQAILKTGPADRKELARAPALYRRAAALANEDRLHEAKPFFEQVLAVHRRMLGDEYPCTALGYNDLASSQYARREFVEAEGNFRKAIDLGGKLLGEEHPDVASGYANLGSLLADQGKHAGAEGNFRKALDLRLKLFGEEHPDTALGYHLLAHSQSVQGKHAGAEGNYRKALALERKLRGEDHLLTATGYNNLGANQKAQGKYAEAESLFRKGLDLRLKLLGDEHPSTATSLNNLAAVQAAQGLFAEAEENSRRALGLRLKLLGEKHRLTAQSYGNLALNQKRQRKYAEAEANASKALALRLEVLGEDDPDTAQGYETLAGIQEARGKHAEAEGSYRKALGLDRKLLGEDHPETAQSYNNLAVNLDEQGKFAEAEENHQKALDRRLRLLGEDHPDTANSYHNLACNQNDQGKYAEAERLWGRSADLFDRTRPWAASSGLGRAAVAGERSPLFRLAAVLARNGKPDLAWRRFEQGLARGAWDDLSQRRHLSAEERAHQARLVRQLDRLDRLIEQAPPGGPTPETRKRREELLGERRRAREELSDWAGQIERKYGPAVGRVFERAAVQEALAADAALLGWVDTDGHPRAADPGGEHWAVLLRSRGEPVWVRLPGSGPDKTWTDADRRLEDDLKRALRKPRGDWNDLARRLGDQRVGPLAGRLAAGDGLPAVRHLVVLPSSLMDGLPADVFAEGYRVSYAPSGTLFAHVRRQKRPPEGGLLVVADPVFDRPGAGPAGPELPPGGLLLDLVAPGSVAARAGLKSGDVLLSYAGSALKGPDDLAKAVQAHAREKEVELSVWRAGKVETRRAESGKLGVVTAKGPAPAVLAERRQHAEKLALARGADDGDWKPLPGTRVEAEALRRLFEGRGHQVGLLTDSRASERALGELARAGELRGYRFVHLATHGSLDARSPLRSAVILSRDQLPDAEKQLEAGLPLDDGRLTAAEVLRDWHLQAELVTLSACETALGKYEPGEGFVGFPQALLLSGARSVCVSLWQVHDTATALVMARFYENLLGARAGLRGPLPKAEALAEAKAWLRGLTRAEALRLAARVTDGVERGKGRPALPPAPPVPGAEGDDAGQRPFAHPYYWSAFLLIGDPD